MGSTDETNPVDQIAAEAWESIIKSAIDSYVTQPKEIPLTDGKFVNGWRVLQSKSHNKRRLQIGANEYLMLDTAVAFTLRDRHNAALRDKQKECDDAMDAHERKLAAEYATLRDRELQNWLIRFRENLDDVADELRKRCDEINALRDCGNDTKRRAFVDYVASIRGFGGAGEAYGIIRTVISQAKEIAAMLETGESQTKEKE